MRQTGDKATRRAGRRRPPYTAPADLPDQLKELLERIYGRLNTLGLSRQRACLNAGLNPDCIRSIENGAYPTLKSLQELASTLHVSVGYLSGGIAGQAAQAASSRSSAYPDAGSPTIGELMEAVPEPFANRGAGAPHPGYALVRPVYGGGLLGTSERGRAATAQAMPFPDKILKNELCGTPQDFLWADIAGDAMAPWLENGDRVLIDTRVTRPVEPAIFGVDEGIGPVARWIEPVGGCDPPTYRVRCEDRGLPCNEIAADRIRIIGRIVWFSRRM